MLEILIVDGSTAMDHFPSALAECQEPTIRNPTTTISPVSLPQLVEGGLVDGYALVLYEVTGIVVPLFVEKQPPADILLIW